MIPSALIAWRSRMGWSVNEAARQLGLSRNGYLAYERGWVWGANRADGREQDWLRRPRPIPKHVELACERLEQIHNAKRA